MAYSGPSSFDNSAAKNWLETLSNASALTRIRRALDEARSFHHRSPRAVSRNDINQIIARLEKRQILVLGRAPKRPLTANKRQPLRNWFASGRYLVEESGPFERALAASEILAIWLGFPSKALFPERITAINKLQKNVPRSLLLDAICTVELILSDKSYRHMRAVYLDAFAWFTGGGDSMRGVAELLLRLKGAEMIEEMKLEATRRAGRLHGLGQFTPMRSIDGEAGTGMK